MGESMEESMELKNPHEKFILQGNLWKVMAQLSWPACR